jgi:Fe-S oxidoreductase
LTKEVCEVFDASKCDKCGDCLVRCQYVGFTREKAVNEITALMEGRYAEILAECMTCMACNEYCQKGANPFDLICQLQGEKRTILVPPATLRQLDSLSAVPNKIIEGDPNKPALSLCIVGDLLPGITESQMFDGLTIFKGGDYYSKIAYLHVGMENTVRDNAQRFVDNLAKLGRKEIVIVHEDCYIMLASKAQEYGIELPFKVIHIVEYMLNYLKEHESSITKLNREIAYQRPCASRYASEKEPVLDELFQLIGVHRVPRRYDREDALCCHVSGCHADSERSKRSTDMNLTDARAHGAEAMVFLCPLCNMSLAPYCKAYGLAPIFIIDLCRMALGEIPSSTRP